MITSQLIINITITLFCVVAQEDPKDNAIVEDTALVVLKTLPNGNRRDGGKAINLKGSKGSRQAALARVQAAHVHERPRMQLNENLQDRKQHANATSYEASKQNVAVAAAFNKYEFFLL